MFTPDPDYVPFCGTPPVPVELMGRWTFDPLLLIGLLALLVFGLTRVPSTGHRRAGFFGGWLITALAFITPLCALSIALFSARVGQHLILVLIAAPLLARGFDGSRVSPMAAAVVFSVFFWFWHVPAPYAATLQSDWVYWAMHLSLLGSAIAWWATLLTQFSQRPLQCFLSAILVGTQMSALSALLVFSTGVWHRWHEMTVPPYGMTALQDQALAGGLMWVFGAAVFVGSIGLLLLRFMKSGQPADKPDRRDPRLRPKGTHPAPNR